MNPPTSCPGENELRRFNQGLADEQEIERVATHLESCNGCLARLRTLVAGAIEKGFCIAAELPPFQDEDSLDDVLNLVHDAKHAELPLTAPVEDGSAIFEITGQPALNGFFHCMDGKWISTGQPVEIRIPLPEITKFDQQAARFLEDAASARELEHPNILPVVSIGSWDSEKMYIAYQHVEGMPLSGIIDRKHSIGIAALRKMTSQILAALRYAHGKDLFHRHLHPQFILIGREHKNIYLHDFGFSWDGRYQLGLIERSIDPSVYDAPETIGNDPRHVDQRSDLYSFGAILAALIQLTDALNSDLKDQLTGIARKCTFPRRSMRFQDVDSLIESVDACFE